MKNKKYSITNTISAITSIVLIAAIFIPENFVINLFRSLILQIGVFSFFVMVISLYKGHKIGTVLNLGHCLIVLFFVSAVITYPKYSTNTPYDLKVAHFNVLKHNDNHQEIIDAAIRSNADLLSFQETDTSWIKDLTIGLNKIYPYSASIPKDDSYFGIAVLSKHPLSNTAAKYFGSRPNIVGDITIENQKVHFIASHTIPPMQHHLYKERNNHIKGIAEYLNTIKGHKIAFGDYNTTPWDKQLIDFKATSKLTDGRSGLCATYPSWLSVSMIPIDYIFHSSEMQCTNFNTINVSSSDHYGIEGCYKLNNKRLAKK